MKMHWNKSTMKLFWNESSYAKRVRLVNKLGGENQANEFARRDWNSLPLRLRNLLNIEFEIMRKSEAE